MHANNSRLFFPPLHKNQGFSPSTYKYWLQFKAPFAYLLKWVFICDVVNKDCSIAVSVVDRTQGMKPLLTSCVLSTNYKHNDKLESLKVNSLHNIKKEDFMFKPSLSYHYIVFAVI